MNWRWLGQDGQGRRVSGLEFAVSSDSLRQQLQQRGIVLLHGRAVAKQAGIQRARLPLAAWWDQLASLLQADLNLMQALDLMAHDRSQPKLAALSMQLAKEVQHGHSLAEAMRRIGPPFPALAIALIDAGEQSGQLPSLVHRLAQHSLRMNQLKQGLWQAAAYPLLVGALSALMLMGMLLFVVPQFEVMFAGFGLALPRLTQALLWASGLARAQLPWLGLLTLLGTGLMWHLRRGHGRWGLWRDALLMRVPGIGALWQQLAVTRIASTLATLLAAGLPLPDSLDAAAAVAGHARHQAALKQCREQVLRGQSLHEALAATAAFPPLMWRLTRLGEESGQLPGMLQRVADQTQARLDHSLARLLTLTEPLLILAMGSLVTAMLLALYLPVFQLTGAMA